MSDAEEIAAKRFGVMNIARIGSIIVMGTGLAIAREVITAPYVLGVALAIAGAAGFFFAPAMLAKRWKAADRAEDRNVDQDAE